MKTWKGKMVRRKNPEKGCIHAVGIVLTNPKETTLSFTPNAVALILVVDVIWGSEIEYFVPLDELIICKS